MQRQLGVNTWVWTSPLDDRQVEELAAKAQGFGYELLELPVEVPGGWDPAAAADVLAQRGMGARIVGAMGDGRDLLDARTLASTHVSAPTRPVKYELPLDRSRKTRSSARRKSAALTGLPSE